MQLNELRQQIERLSKDRARVFFRAHAGLESLSLASFHRSWSHVVTVDSFEQVRESSTASEGRRALRLRRLASFLADLLAEQRAATAIDALDANGRTAVIPNPDDGSPLPLQQAILHLTRQRSADARQAMARSFLHQLAANDRHRITHLEALHDTSERQGYPSVVDRIADLASWNPKAFAEECRRFLNDTEGMYRDVLAWRLRRVNAPRPYPHGARWHDVLYAVNPTEFEGIFQSPPSRIEAEFLKIGLHPRADGRIRVDDDNRPSRTSRAVTVAIDPPGDIALIHRPVGGFEDTWNRLSALGQALHAANTTAERPFEDRMPGDEAVPLGFGAVLGHLLLDREWLDRILQAKAPDLVRVLALSILTRARHDAALTLSALSLHQQGPGEAAREAYAETLSQALLGEWPAGLLLHETDPTFTSATRLRGLALESVLHHELLTRFDEDWWRNPGTGAWLHSLFALGRFEDAEELARRFAAERGEVVDGEGSTPESESESELESETKRAFRSLHLPVSTGDLEPLLIAAGMVEPDKDSRSASGPTPEGPGDARRFLKLDGLVRRLEILID